MPIYPTPGNGNAPVSVPTRELQIPLSIAELERMVDRLVKASAELGTRLGPILQPNETPGQNLKEAPTLQQAEYVKMLSVNSARIRVVCETLEDLLSRLEL